VASTSTGSGAIEQALSHLRILIVHAGGDSRRLPAYGPCGKIFVPLPGAPASPLPPALFAGLCLPSWRSPKAFQAGDRWWSRPATLSSASTRPLSKFSQPGLIALGCHAAAEEASRHGVFCMGAGGAVSLYLQKPSIETQQSGGSA